jgi:hypothetical protein
MYSMALSCILCIFYYNKNTAKVKRWWLMPVILATQEAAIRRIRI